MKGPEVGKEVCSFLAEKLALFNRYLSITERMKKTLKDEDARNFKAFVSERRACIDRIEKIDLYTKKIITQNAGSLSNISERFKRTIDSHQKDIKSVIEAIGPIERDLTGMVRQEGKRLKAELLRMRTGRHAVRNYKKGTAEPPRFLDHTK